MLPGMSEYRNPKLQTLHPNYTGAEQAGIFLDEGITAIFWQRGHIWEELSKTVNAAVTATCAIARISPALFNT